MKLPSKVAAVTVTVATALGLAACADTNGGGSSTEEATTEVSATTTSTRTGEAAISVVDAAGRSLTFDEVPERIVLAEGRATFATAALQDNPFEHVVAYGDDLEKAASAFREKLFEIAPEAKDMPVIGSIQKGDVTVENLLAQVPDVVVMTLDQKKATEESGFLADMDAAGIPYAFIDFRQKPLENTTVSMSLLGGLLGQEERAEKFNEFYEGKVRGIKDRVAETTERPDTAVWAAGGFNDCCSIVGDANLGTLVDAAGGHNIGPDVLDADNTPLTVEKFVEIDPDRIIVTGGEWARDPSKTDAYRHVELGYQADLESTLKTFNSPLLTPGLELLSAPKNGDYYAVYHQFYDNPFNVFALEAFAKWLHPEQFEDVDPAKDFEEFHKEWLPFDYSGVFFVGPEEAAATQ